MKKIVAQLKHFTQFIPIRLNFIVFSLISLLVYSYVKSNKSDTSSFYGFFDLMALIAFWLILILLILSLASTLISYLYFKRFSNQLNVKFVENLHPRKGKQIFIKTSIPKIFKPLLGSISARFLYNDEEMSQRFILHHKMKNDFLSFTPGVTNTSLLQLPDIKDYQLKAAFIYFEDLFRFFSFAGLIPLKQQFTNMPKTLENDALETEPKATKEEEIRIKKLKRVDGEWLEYKKFESSDDIRKIVWKVFAKNRELLVRKQEIFTPFASHIYMFVSFYTQMDKYFIYERHFRQMSNYYKNVSWSIFYELSKMEYEIKLILDQKVRIDEQNAKAEAQRISLCDWQHDTALNEWFDPKKGSILILHSLINTTQLSYILDKCKDQNIKIYYVVLDKIFNRSAIKWLSYIFYRVDENELSELQQSWTFHPLRLILKNQQKENLKLIQNNQTEVEIIA